MAYATAADVAAVWGRTFTEAETEQATALLDYAAAIIDANATIDSTDEKQLKAAEYVSCAMVIRAMQASNSDAFGVNNMSATMGPFSQQITYSNPSGDLYLTGSERTMLGGNGVLIGSIRPKIGVYDD